MLVAYSAQDGQAAQDGDESNRPFAEGCSTISASLGLRSMLFRNFRDDVRSRPVASKSPSPMDRFRRKRSISSAQ